MSLSGFQLADGLPWMIHDIWLSMFCALAEIVPRLGSAGTLNQTIYSKPHQCCNQTSAMGPQRSLRQCHRWGLERFFMSLLQMFQNVIVTVFDWSNHKGQPRFKRGELESAHEWRSSRQYVIILNISQYHHSIFSVCLCPPPVPSWENKL